MDEAWSEGVEPDEANVEREIGTNNVRISFGSDDHGTVRVLLLKIGSYG